MYEEIPMITDYEVNIDFSDKESAMNEIMKIYTKKVYLLAYSFVKDQGMAEDISQEVFIKCYKHLHQFRGDSSIKTWIYRITVNSSKDFIKKRNFHLLKFPLSFFERFTDKNEPEREILNHFENEELIQAIFQLSSKYREVIVLYYFHELKIEEVGAALGINPNTVKTRLARGRLALKDKLTWLEGGDLHG